jgi:hypothetical protein
MASIIETYNEKIKDSTFQGNIKIKEDLTPYSIGTGNGTSADTKLGDEKAIVALEAKGVVQRYGVGVLPKGATDSKQEYSKRIDVNK